MSLRRLILCLIMVFAAVAASAWPAMADWGMRVPLAQGQSMDHAMAMSHGDHDAMTAGHLAAPCDDQGDMGSRHCGSMVMACGTGIAGTLPVVLDMPHRLAVTLVLWAAPDDSLAARSVLPGLRPPRSFV